MTARRLLDHVARAAFTAVLLGVVVILGQIPMGKPSGVAVVRFALRTVHGKVEVCKDRTQEELLALPPHMRTPRICDTFTPTYRLQVMVDREPLLDREVFAGGVRGDRPLIVDDRIAVAPGRKHLEVLFAPIVSEDVDSEALAALMELPHFRLDQWVELEADRITLVLLDEVRQSLEVYAGG